MFVFNIIINKNRKRFTEKKHSCGFVFQKQPTHSLLLNTKHLQCVSDELLNFNLILCSVPEQPPLNIRTCSTLHKTNILKFYLLVSDEDVS